VRLPQQNVPSIGSESASNRASDTDASSSFPDLTYLSFVESSDFYYMDSSPQLRHLLRNMAESEPTSLPTPAACLAGTYWCVSILKADMSTSILELRLTPVDLIILIHITDNPPDFCIIPIGTPSASVSSEVAAVQRLLKKSKIQYTMHSAGTTLGMPIIPSKASSPNLKSFESFPTATSTLTSTLPLPTEGSWDEVMHVIGQAHTLLHANGVARIQSDIRVGSRTDKKQKAADKVAKVEQLLAQDEEAKAM
jgi:uncharacterized protein YqgV (UPF0045/DUF77 family)